MPELPEVETIRRDLEKKILHRKITAVHLTEKMRIKTPSLDVCEILLNNKIVGAHRIGKLLYFELPKKLFWLVHLKMTGQLIWVKGRQSVGGGHSLRDERASAGENKYMRAWLDFSDGSRLYFNDLRRFGYWQVVEENDLKKVLRNYGIEPLTASFIWENFKGVFVGRKTSVKALLLNQKIFSGLGNIYVDEACFLAGVRPMRRADSLTIGERKKLFSSIKKVINKAIAKRGTTFNSFVDSDGQKGNFVKYLQVYGRSGEKCKKCKTGLICRVKTAGRGTCYCPHCQK
ncbi:MAG TPA: bifunctional DNA-formamidopyrimidine glycosylase/DNA-(apurinic or apyrimidinic site) lyase [Candidatus Magasanikbacteria bacterium]|nr:bifunctional DNA-formamidopyrimidine glycosylase/DNA-(apurinic or apyrimidinic site) lyase [Candidatus Magasanikbacteria bacterium]